MFLVSALLFFASVTVFTLPMMQDDANTDLTLTEKVTIMANAGDGGDGDEDAYVTCYYTLKISGEGETEWVTWCGDCQPAEVYDKSQPHEELCI